MNRFFFALVISALSLSVAAESSIGPRTATASLTISITVPPVLRIDSVTPVAGGLEYRGFTNLRSAMLGGVECNFAKPGPFVVVVPALQAPTGLSAQIVSNP